MSDSILKVRDLSVGFDTDSGPVTAVDGVSFEVPRGKTLGIVGESGCGKSVTAMSIMRLLPQPMGKILGGQVLFGEDDLTKIPAAKMRAIRGSQISMIFQEPMTALNPVHRIGKQLSEVFLLHNEEMDKKAAWEASVEILGKVGIPSPEIRVGEFPHQLSGGMRQRVVIAMALALKPSLVIADEPTTALDVTIQAQILELMKSLQAEMGMSIIMITHDLGVIAETCDEVVVMYAGRVAERGSIDTIFNHPQHLYTKGLLESIPRLEHPRKKRLSTITGMVPGLDEMPVGARFAPRSPSPKAEEYMATEAFNTTRPELRKVSEGHWVENEPAVLVSSLEGEPPVPPTPPPPPEAPDPAAEQPEAPEPPPPPEPPAPPSAEKTPLLKIRDLKVHFPVKGGVLLRAKAWCKAVDGVDLMIKPGETLGLVGESGCGKSTLGKSIVRLNNPTAGQIDFEGKDLAQTPTSKLKAFRRDVQMIFQDPAESLNARHTVGALLEEPFRIHKIGTLAERRQKVLELLDIVGLRPGAANRFPFEFSGGQRQRIGIARAIALNPKLVICDEPVSALDVSVQSQILNLLLDLQQQFKLSYLFIAHDLAVVKHISDRIAIMYLGKIVEVAPADEIFTNPLHAYTKALISAIPEPTPTPTSTSTSERESKRILLKGDVPSPINPPAGSAFARRSWMDCPEEWLDKPGVFKEVKPEHWVEVHPATVEDWEQHAPELKLAGAK